ncbi:MAG: type II toxin-antitoxin system VapC family toxin [Burkholderiaceae bacterium]|nr:type II toxin-antitoxin system VapC family toxin [Burkholderiaceae bacterium]
MYLIDTNVVSEARKGSRADRGVRRFFDEVVATGDPVHLSSITVGELRRGVESIRHRGDGRQAALLEAWLLLVLEQYRDNVLDFDAEAAQVWGRLCVPLPEHAIDKQIAAIALVNDLTVVTRNTSDFEGTGVRVVDPFEVRE